MIASRRIAAGGGATLLCLLPIGCGADAVPGTQAPPWDPPAGPLGEDIVFERRDLGADPEPFYWHGEVCPAECGEHEAGWHAFSPRVGPELVRVRTGRLSDGRLVVDLEGPEPRGRGVRPVFLAVARNGTWEIHAAGLRRISARADGGYAPRPRGRVTVDPRSTSPGGPLIFEFDLESPEAGLLAQGRVVLEEVRAPTATPEQELLDDAGAMAEGSPLYPDPAELHGERRQFGMAEGIRILPASLDIRGSRMSGRDGMHSTDPSPVAGGPAPLQLDVVRVEPQSLYVHAWHGEPWYEYSFLTVQVSKAGGEWAVDWVTVYLDHDLFGHGGWAESLEGSVRYEADERDSREVLELEVDLEGATRAGVEIDVYAELLVDPSEAR